MSASLSRGLVLACLVLLVSTPASARSFDMPSYLRAYANQKRAQHVREPRPRALASFLDTFAYGRYLAEISITDFVTLQNDRLYVYRMFDDGDHFLFRVCEEFLKQNPLTTDAASLRNRISLAEAFLSPAKPGISNPAVNEAYRVIGLFMLGEVSRKIADELASHRIDWNAPLVAEMHERLRRHKVDIPHATDSAAKVMANLRQGQWAYLAQRVRAKVRQHTRWSIAGLVFFLIIALQRWCQKAWLKWPAVLGCLVLGVLIVEQRLEKRHGYHFLPLCRELPFRQDNQGEEFAFQVYRVTNENWATAGTAVMMIVRDELSGLGAARLIRPTFLAGTDLVPRFGMTRSKNNLLVATAAAYTANRSAPEGLSAIDGNILNSVIMHDRHALTIIEPDGALHVHNLKEDFELDFLSGEPTCRGKRKMKSPLASLSSYVHLLECIRSTRSSAFQTHLLSHNDRSLLKEANVSQEQAARRVLAVVHDLDRKSRVTHVVLYFPSPMTLARAADEAHFLLHKRGKYIRVLMNLDTGMYDIMDVFDAHGAQLPDARGRVGATTANNLLVYTAR